MSRERWFEADAAGRVLKRKVRLPAALRRCASPARPSTPLVLVLIGTLGLACSGRTAWELGLGSFTADFDVVRVVPRHQWLEATVSGNGLALRFYAPASEDCTWVLTPEAEVEYVERGVGGRYQRGDRRCDAVGIGDPLLQRARHPRSGSLRSSPVPRSQATFRAVYRDNDVIMLRGRFPEARRIGWAGADDTVAVLPHTDECELAAEGGVASMEFRASGRNTLALVSKKGLCRIVGLILPKGRP